MDQWISDFLNRRGLKQPDGRPLFAYKTSSEEFEALCQLLKKTPYKKNISVRFSQVWLLFAAEWWKRKYSGGAWRWGPLTDLVGLNGLSYGQIRQMVIDGHSLWSLQTAIKKEGKRFIGLVAVNGGLPMRLVESAQGGVSGILRMVTRQALQFGLQNDQIRQAIEAQAALLPLCYQQTPVYELLENVVTAVLRIRTTFDLESAVDPIHKLQSEYPNWEESFPIALDTQAAATLIRGLVKEVVGVSSQSYRPPFQIQRCLRFSSDGSTPVYEVIFLMQAQAKREKLAEALGVAQDSLPPNFQLLLRIGETEHLVAEALLRADEYQLIAKPLPKINKLHDAAQLIVSRWGATLHVATLSGGEALSPDEPLIFENAYPVARLLAQGDAVVRGDSALAIMPAKTIVFSEDGDAKEIVECLSDGQTLLELPSGTTRLTYKQQSFVITISENILQTPDAYWIGNGLEVVSVPAMLFKGIPRLRIEHKDGGGSYAPSHELFVRNQGKNVPLFQAQPSGLCRLLWCKDGRRLLSTRAVLLRKEASISYIPGGDPSEGCIRLHLWPNVPVRCENEDIELKTIYDGTDLTLYLKCNSTRPANMVKLCLQWSDGEQKLTLRFPGYGVTLLRNEAHMRSNETLTFEQLIGCRAVLMSAQGAENWQVRITSSGIDHRSSLVKEIRYTGIQEIRLFELIPTIQQMLSCRTGLDRTAQLEFIHAHQTRARLQIGRYSTHIRLHSQGMMASLSEGNRDLILEEEQAHGLIMGLPLAEPEHEQVNLPLHFTEQVFTGNWQVNLPDDAVGPWLLYTKEDSPLYSRPAIVPPAVELSKPLSPLREALCESNWEERSRLLRAALGNMADDPRSEDWQTLELLLDKLHHLPLASLDLFQALIREPKALAMCTLLLDDFSSHLAERIPNELPFEWLLVSPHHWLHTFEMLRLQLVGDNPRLLAVIRNDIQVKSKFLSRWQPALSFIFDQGLHRYFDLKSQDVGVFLNAPFFLTDIWLSQLFDGGEKSAMQQMFHRNPAENNQYPGGGNIELSAFLSTSYGQQILQRCKLPKSDFKLAIVMVPFMAAFDTYSGQGHHWQADPSKLFSLRNARQFDTVWFDLAYQLGLAIAQADSMKK